MTTLLDHRPRNKSIGRRNGTFAKRDHVAQASNFPVNTRMSEHGLLGCQYNGSQQCGNWNSFGKSNGHSSLRRDRGARRHGWFVSQSDQCLHNVPDIRGRIDYPRFPDKRGKSAPIQVDVHRKHNGERQTHIEDPNVDSLLRGEVLR